jgi:protein gp37
MNREGPGKTEYLDWTWNPVVGCTNGCAWCWARRQAKRQKKNCRKCYRFEPHLHPERLDEPLRLRRPSVIGVAFMGELFDSGIGYMERVAVFATMAQNPRHTFVVLTKQPDLACQFMDRALNDTALCLYGGAQSGVKLPLPNVVLGVSVEDQARLEERMPHLEKLAAMGWRTVVSIEPCLGSIRIPDSGLRNLQGVIVGGQTGPDAVPMHPDWVRKVRDDCQAAGVPFYFKQWGEWIASLDVPSGYADTYSSKRHGSRNEGRVVGDEFMARVGRKAAGRRLDGRTWDGLAWGNSRPEA